MARAVKLKPWRPRDLGWRRHLVGWPPALLIVVAALIAAILGVPRPVSPRELPLPDVSWREAEVLQAQYDLRAKAAAQNQLPFEVREVGELLRMHGRTSAKGQKEPAALALHRLRRAVVIARSRHGDEPLLQLRAVQSWMFLDALRHWEESGDEQELADLAGPFAEVARENHWVEDGKVVLTELERLTLFRLRWSRLTGLMQEYPFAPTQSDWKIYYRFLLLHPEGETSVEMLRSQLEYVGAVERRDPKYPSALARGILLYHLQKYPLAIDALQSHIEKNPGGPWHLRARNFLAAALKRQREQEAALGM